jgi:cholesterol oxidase
MSHATGTTPLGLEFTETMRGFVSTAEAETEADDYRRAAARGERDGSPFEFTVTVTADDLDRFLEHPDHEAGISGTVHAPALSGAPLKVEGGTFRLMIRDADHPSARKMTYRMPLRAEDGRAFTMEGFKTIHDAQGPRVWSDTTTLFVTVREGADGAGPVAARGVVTIHLKDFQRQLASTKVTGARNAGERLRALARFGRFFAGALSEVYGGVCARSNVFNPDAPPRERRPLRCGEPEVHFFDTADGVGLKLSRFRGGKKGPVILTPGFGTSALAYTIDTTETNFPEYLFERGYDVWVLDYRSSPDLPSAATQFTLDDVAAHDYPAAVAHVRGATGADTVQVMAHCVGSLTFMMAMANGLEGVRSAVCSQLTFHPVAPPLNKVKAGLHLASLLNGLGVETLTTDFDTTSSGLDRLCDTLLRLYPTRERCNSPVCRRILFLYGEVYDHDQLNAATHGALHEMFGVANMTTFRHLTRMLQAGHVVDAAGNDRYLPNAGRLNIPIAFLHGEHNRLFLPEGSERTYQFLCERNGPELYSRHVVPGYAHMDCFIGKNASRDVYPVVTRELDRYNPA